MADESSRAPGVGLAIVAALLFGASVPAAHWLVGELPPVLMSALLYLGSGTGLALVALPGFLQRCLAGGQPLRGALVASDWRASATWQLGAAILLGGVVAPIAMLFGLQHTAASSAAVLLNLEGVATAGLAWWVFGEAVDRSVAIGMLCVVLAGALLAWPETPVGPSAVRPTALAGPALLLLACLAWGLDNNLTRGVSNLDARTIAMAKGLVAGTCNLALAAALGGGLTALGAPLRAGGGSVALAALLGLFGYGVSLVAYVQAQARLGAARTGAWFGLSPFIGVAVALWVLHEPTPRLLLPACLLLALGLWLHVRERHAHWHQHLPLQHTHRHRHDDHHQHTHAFDWDGQEPHAHAHAHPALLHRHVHFPDLHHRHAHADIPEVPASASILPPALIAAYQRTAYHVDPARQPFPAGHGAGFTLWIGKACPAARALLQSLDCHGAAFLTAANPLGRACPDEENAQRTLALQTQLSAAGLAWRSGRGEGDDPAWPAEPSVLVCGVSKAEALLLAHAWEQNAVVWLNRDGVAALLLLR